MKAEEDQGRVSRLLFCKGEEGVKLETAEVLQTSTEMLFLVEKVRSRDFGFKTPSKPVIFPFQS